MGTDWEQNFRKLQERPSMSFLRLPAWVRGYGDEMVRFAERPHGRICETTKLEDLAFVLRCHEDELVNLADAVSQLLVQGFLVEREGALVVTNFEKAQKSADALRKARWRAKQTSGTDVPDEQDNSDDRPAGPGQASTVPNKKRRDRREEIERSQAVARVFIYWQTKLEHPGAKLDASRKRKILSRLNDFTEQELMLAVDGCASSAWHMGDNDNGKRYDAIDLIFRNAAKVEEFVALGRDAQAANAKRDAHRRREEAASQVGDAGPPPGMEELFSG
jgi:hypothetical protein